MTLYDQDNTEVNEVIEIVSCEETDLWEEADQVEARQGNRRDWILAAVCIVATICVVVAFTVAQINQKEGFTEPGSKLTIVESGLQTVVEHDTVSV